MTRCRLKIVKLWIVLESSLTTSDDSGVLSEHLAHSLSTLSVATPPRHQEPRGLQGRQRTGEGQEDEEERSTVRKPSFEITMGSNGLDFDFGTSESMTDVTSSGLYYYYHMAWYHVLIWWMDHGYNPIDGSWYFHRSSRMDYTKLLCHFTIGIEALKN